MKNKFENIDEALEIKATSISKEIVKKSKEQLVKPSFGEESDKDYEYTRGNLYSLIEKGQEAIDNIIDLAQQSDSPRAYEVAGQLIKSVGDVTDKLIDLQHKMKKLKEEDVKGPSTVNNSVFIGSTADLQKLLKQGLMDSK
jgi:DNA-binding MarR family transcriptional regulator